MRGRGERRKVRGGPGGGGASKGSGWGERGEEESEGGPAGGPTGGPAEGPVDPSFGSVRLAQHKARRLATGLKKN